MVISCSRGTTGDELTEVMECLKVRDVDLPSSLNVRIWVSRRIDSFAFLFFAHDLNGIPASRLHYSYEKQIV